jgi:hypothetical protein
VGAAGVFDRRISRASSVPAAAVAPDAVLTFTREADGDFRDAETGTSWNNLGRATSGLMKGAELGIVFHGNAFWFAWAAFRPETRVWQIPTS